MVYAMWSYTLSKEGSRNLKLALLGVGVGITAYHVQAHKATFHQIAYATLTGLVLFRSIYIMHTRLKDRQALKTMWILIAIGVTSFLTGFAVWIADNEYCGTILAKRRQIGLPWGLFLGK